MAEEYETHQVQVKNPPESQEYLSLKVESLLKGNTVTSHVYSHDKKNALVTLENDISDTDIPDDPIIQILKLPLPKSVLVTNIPTSQAFSEDHLMMSLEKEFKDHAILDEDDNPEGDDSITSVDHQKGSTLAVINFSNSKDALAVINASNITFHGQNVQMKKYYEWLEKPQTISETEDEPEDYEPVALPRDRADSFETSTTVETTNITKNPIMYASTPNLSAIVGPFTTWKTYTPSKSISPKGVNTRSSAINSQTAKQSQPQSPRPNLQRHNISAPQEACEDLYEVVESPKKTETPTKRYEVFPESEEESPPPLPDRKSRASSEIRSPSRPPKPPKPIKKQTSVDDVELLSPADSITETIKCNHKHDISLLRLYDLNFPRCKIEYREDLRTVTITGPKQEVDNVQVRVFEVIQTTCEAVVFTQQDAAVIELLERNESQYKIRSLMKNKGLKVILVVERTPKMEIKVISYDSAEIQTARTCISEMVEKQVIPLTPNMKSVLQATNGQETKSKIEKNYGVPICLKDNQLTIAGWKADGLANKATDELSEFLKKNSKITKKLHVQRGIGRYLDEYKKQDMKNEVKTLRSNKSCALDVGYNQQDNVFNISGNDLAVQEIEKILADKYIKKAKYKLVIHNRTGLVTYLKTDVGKTVLKSIETSEKCYIRYEYDASKTPQASPRKRSPSPIKAATPVDQTSQDSNVLTFNSTKITLSQGDITKENKCDVLVNVVGKELDLSRGQAAIAFSKAGGPDLQKDLTPQAPAEWGDVKKTTGGKLKCKEVYHVALPPHRSQHGTKMLEDALTTCMDEAAAKHSSIGFPSLGCGNLHWSPDNVVSCMLDAASKHSTGKGKHLKHINVIVYDGAVYKAFAHEFSVRSGAKSKHPGSMSASHSKTGTSKRSSIRGSQSSAVEVEFHIFAGWAKAIANAEEKIKKMINENTGPKINDPSVENISIKVVDQLIAECKKKFGVDVSIDRKRCEIKFEGETSSTKDAQLHYNSVMRNELGRVQEKDPEEVRQEQGEKAYLYALSSEQVKHPQYWTKFKSSNYILASLETWYHGDYRSADVDKKMFKAIEDTMLRTWRGDLIGHGRDAVGLAHKSIKIQNIKRIENPELYMAYAEKRQKMFRIAAEGHIHPIDKQHPKCPVPAVKTKGSSELDALLFHQVNEYFLFHGTKADTINSICAQGLDNRVGNDQGMFGSGAYGAESSTKADQYVDDKSNRVKGPHKILILRMLLGNAFICSKADEETKFKRPPCSKCNKRVCKDHIVTYDSVVSNTTHHFREFIVYSKEQSYPEFVVTYDRV